jgi:2-polyprenyl-6-methoxyphenol hydroxylase-like FAD-dependent oxidoreductase
VPERTYDIVTVGGGLGGAAVALTMAARGATVLVVERERRFVDRVRGEALAPWGVESARALGIDAALDAAGGHELRWLELYFAGSPVSRRDVPATTPQGAGWLAFYHPAAQERLLEAAVGAGAAVRRGVRVRDVRPGSPAIVTLDDAGVTEEIAARLVVGADGRGSLVRRWGGFETRRDPERHLFSGVLFEHHAAPPDASTVFFHPGGRIGLCFPQGGGRVRAYVGFHRDAEPPRASDYTVERFVDEAVHAGVPAQWYDGAKPAGPLAMFDATDSWVDHPYRDGVALVGDAAATSDPTWGQGMSLTLRDARTLADRLSEGDDWERAGHAYAAEHDRYAEIVRRADGWLAALFLTVGPDADARRLRALPLLAEDETRLVDVATSGPDIGIDERSRRRLFGEE